MAASEAQVQTNAGLSSQQQISASEDHIDESGQRCWGIDVSRLSKGSYGHDRCRKLR